MPTNVLPLQDARAALEAAYRSGDEAKLRAAANDYVRSKKRRDRSLANARDTTGMGPGGSFREGLGAGMMNVARRGTGMLLPRSMEDSAARAMGLTDRLSLQDQIAEQERLDAKANGPGRFKTGKFLGEMVATAPVGMGAGAAIRGGAAGARALVGAAPKAGKLAGLVANATEGALGSQMTTGDAGTGAVFGAASLPVMKLLGKAGKALGSGITRTADADTLIKLGAKLDLGQMNPGGAADRLIKAARSAPLGMGARITAQREANLRPVVGNLASDIAGIARGPVDSARRGVDRAARVLEGTMGRGAASPLTAPQRTANLLRQAEAAQAGRDATQRVLNEGVDAKAALMSKADLADAAASESKVALRRALRSKDPDLIKAKKIRRAEADVALGNAQARADDFDQIAVQKAADKAGVEAAEKTDSIARTAFNQQMQAHAAKGGYRVPKGIQRIIDGETAVFNKEKLTVKDLKQAASNLKSEARNIRYGRNPNFTGRRNAETLEHAAQQFERQVREAIRDAGGNVRMYDKANRRYGQIKVLEEALYNEGATAHGLLSGEAIEKSLKKTLGKRGFRMGKGGQLRKTAEALKRLENPTEAGPMQASSVPNWAVRMIQGTVGKPLSSDLVGAVARGDHKIGKAFNKMGQTRAGQGTLDILEMLRHGVPGAAMGAME